MSTVSKGTSFENKVYGNLVKELRDDRLGLSPNSARVFQRKGYYSRDRDGKIILDITIEVWLPNADTWSFLWVCECKDYKKSIPVDDLEEFKSKLDQVAGANKKGFFATTSVLQKSAFNFANTNLTSHSSKIVLRIKGKEVKV